MLLVKVRISSGRIKISTVVNKLQNSVILEGIWRVVQYDPADAIAP